MPNSSIDISIITQKGLYSSYGIYDTMINITYMDMSKEEIIDMWDRVYIEAVRKQLIIP